MKIIKINPYFRQLIKDNFTYILGFIIILFLSFSILFFGLRRVSNINNNIKKLRDEIAILSSKAELINIAIPAQENLDEDIKILNQLIPNTEDYFSIIYALEKLSQETGFMIVDYTVNIGTSTPNKLKLTVTGLGDADSFLKFLQNYQFGGGRLITSDNILLSQNLNGTVKLDLTFYNKKTDIKSDQLIQPDKNLFKFINKVKSKIGVDYTNLKNSSDKIDYPAKDKPFN